MNLTQAKPAPSTNAPEPVEKPGTPSLDRWRISGRTPSSQEERGLLRRLAGVEVRPGGELVLAPVDASTGVVGHIVQRDGRQIPRPDSVAETSTFEAFRLSRGRKPDSGYLVLTEPALRQLRKHDGWFARVVPSVVGALCVPLAMAPVPAFASASASRRGRQGEAQEEADLEDEANVDLQEPVEPAAAAPADPAPAAGPPPTEPAPAATAAPAAAAPQGLPDATWNAMVGKNVEISVTGGLSATGQLVAVDATSASIAKPTGEVVAVPRSTVTGVRLLDAAAPPPAAAAAVPPPDAPPPGKSPTGLLVGGSIMVSIGAVLTISGAVLTGLYAGSYCSSTVGGSSDCTGGGSSAALFAGTILVPGLLLVGGGGAMLGVGVKRKRRNRRAAQVSIAPNLRKNSWGGVLRVAF